MMQKISVPVAIALGLGVLSGCEGQSASRENQQDPNAVSFFHEPVESAPSLSLGTYQYNPAGTGIRSSAAQVGQFDSSVNYGLALRSAAIKLTGDLPTLADILKLDAAVKSAKGDGSDLDPAKVYADLVQKYLDTPKTFNAQILQFWRNTLRMGGTVQGLVDDSPTNMLPVNLESAPNFAAKLVVDGADMRTLFTKASNTCPTYTAATGAFTDGSCVAQNMSNVAETKHAGILTNPGFLAHYYGNFGFRRTRVVQELFACVKFPVEFAAAPKLVNSALYTSPWPEKSITNAETPPPNLAALLAGRKIRGGAASTEKNYIDFSIAGSCAGCHTTLNHMTPLFINFDAIGFERASSRVNVPLGDSPFSQRIDYIPAAEATAWRYNVPAKDMKELGERMAADDTVAKCFMTRAWNQAFSKADVVNDQAMVPDVVIKDLTRDFMTKHNYNMKKALYDIYTHPNFIRF